MIIHTTPKAKELDQQARNACMRCQLQNAGILIAIAIGHTLADKLARCTGASNHIPKAREAAGNGDWQQADLVARNLLQERLTLAQIAMEMDRDPEPGMALAPATIMAKDVGFAVLNLQMADECLNGNFKPQPGYPQYKLRHHLWNCANMAIAKACETMQHDAEALQKAEQSIVPCTHQAAKDWALREAQRIRQNAATEPG